MKYMPHYWMKHEIISIINAVLSQYANKQQEAASRVHNNNTNHDSLTHLIEPRKKT